MAEGDVEILGHSEGIADRGSLTPLSGTVTNQYTPQIRLDVYAHKDSLTRILDSWQG
jgi:hypothetical protein